jgi:hypothetical protein
MRLLQIQARSNEEVDCLIRELAVYAPRRSRRSILIELKGRSEAEVLGLLAAVETCLSANDIPNVRIELDGTSYVMEPRRVDR